MATLKRECAGYEREFGHAVALTGREVEPKMLERPDARR